MTLVHKKHKVEECTSENNQVLMDLVKGQTKI